MPGGHPELAVGPAALRGSGAGRPWPRPETAPHPADDSQPLRRHRLQPGQLLERDAVRLCRLLKRGSHVISTIAAAGCCPRFRKEMTVNEGEE